jgi:hypothetical protein
MQKLKKEKEIEMAKREEGKVIVAPVFGFDTPEVSKDV